MASAVMGLDAYLAIGSAMVLLIARIGRMKKIAATANQLSIIVAITYASILKTFATALRTVPTDATRGSVVRLVVVLIINLTPHSA